MHLTGVDLLFWAAGFGAHLTLLYVLVLRRRFPLFPMFTALIALDIGRTIVLYLVECYGGRAGYFYTFWSLGILDTVLQFAVIYEMYSRTFRPFGVWARDLRGGFAWLAALNLAAASGLTWLAAPAAHHWIQVIVIKGNFFSSVCLSGLFVGMIVLSVHAGLPWKTHVARISQGLGVYSLIDVLIETGHSYFGVSGSTRIYTDLSHFRMGVYLVCVAYWIVMLWQNEPEPRKLSDGLRSHLIRLQNLVDADLDRIRVRKQW